ncbi:MAG: bifunctional oligoribonuclease/PAP phosphatase NrnA [Clostridia bacterium]|nr:bifunctional oligoribonuclease/PAP phosphatase NrnA [Clostridia bacterium]
MNDVMKKVFEQIEAAEVIMLFRHVRVDGDCVGATKGLKEIILKTWPQKQAYIIDDERSDYLAFLGPDDAPVADDVYRNALGVVIDVGNSARISNPKYSLCRKIIKIDHHIEREPYGDINWVEEGRSSASEMIAAFYEAFSDRLKMSAEAALYLYTGIVTDSGRFLYEGVKGDTMRLAGLLLDQGIDTQRLYAHLNLCSFDEIKFRAQVYADMQVTENGVAYVRVTRGMQERFCLTQENAGNAVDFLRDIRGILCWMAFIETPTDEIRVRLRSRFAAINTLAERYGGGGHAMASGARVYSEEAMLQLIADADAHIKAYKEENTDWL